MCELIPWHVGCRIGAVVCEIIPDGEGLERLSEGGAVVGKNIVEVSHLAITSIGGISIKLPDNIVSEPFRHIQCPDNGTVFVVTDAALQVRYRE